MKRAIRKALALLLSVTVFTGTIDFSVYAAESEQETVTVGEESVGEKEESTEKVSTEESKEEIGTREESSEEESTEDVSTVKESTEEISIGEENTEAENTEEVTTEEQSSYMEEIKESVYEANNYKVIFTLTEQWNDGYNALIKIENTSDTVIHDWYLEVDSAYEITNLWNAEVYKNAEEKIIFKNAGWNQDIAVGSYVEFGFVGTGEFQRFPEKYEILGESTKTQEEDYSIEYYLENDWGSGFSGKITISNHTDTVLEDWTLEFDFNRSITSIWDGTIESEEDNHYIIRNAGYNANIEAGQTVSFGFNGENGQKEEVPFNYKLYTYEILNDEWIELADGKIDREYIYKKIYPNLLMKGLSIENVKLSDL